MIIDPRHRRDHHIAGCQDVLPEALAITSWQQAAGFCIV